MQLTQHCSKEASKKHNLMGHTPYAYVIDIADAGEQKTQQGEIKLKHLLVQMTPVPYPLGYGASWLMSARQVPSWLTPARQVMLLQLLARAWHHCCHCFCAQNQERQRGDPNPCGQSPMDFGSISLPARTRYHALVSGLLLLGLNL